MRLSVPLRPLALAMVFALPISGCSLLNKVTHANHVSKDSRSNQGSDTNTTASNTTTDSLKNHPLFRNASLVLLQQDCTFDYDRNSPDTHNVESYASQEVACMDKAWNKVFTSPGITAADRAAPLKFVHQNSYKHDCSQELSTSVTTTCVHSFYFRSNGENFENINRGMNIYAVFTAIQNAYPWWLVDNIGIDSMVSEEEKQAGSETAEAFDINKRYRLSVQCLGGLYFGSQYKDAADDQDFFNYFYRNMDDAVGKPSAPATNDDPSGQHYIDWFRKGVDSGGHPSACNTWIAPAAEVS